MRKRGRGVRKYLAFILELGWIAASPFAALLIRHNFDVGLADLEKLFSYALLTIASATLVFLAAGLHRRIWRFASLNDILRLLAACSVALGVALFAGFAWNRLDGISRALPILQWLIMVAGLAGMRVAARLLLFRARGAPIASDGVLGAGAPEHVLIIGLNPLTELYLRALQSYAQGRLAVAGILASGARLKNRILQQFEVLGAPEDIRLVLREQDSHGVNVTRIVLTEPIERLSQSARKALVEVQNERNLRIEPFCERLGLFPEGGEEEQADRLGNDTGAASDAGREGAVTAAPPEAPGACAQGCGVAPYGLSRLKRLLDFAGASILILLLAPVLALVSLLVVIGIGRPLTFFQMRPGLDGRPFRLYKFRTMRPTYDERSGRFLSEAERETAIGRLLRRFRLDELPQLYNILVGEMSFVGPRPLLARDLPRTDEPLGERVGERLEVRPGLTGWAQINGGRDVTPSDKVALDLWYVRHASLARDLEIVWRTAAMVLWGERLNGQAIAAARADLGPHEPPSTATASSAGLAGGVAAASTASEAMAAPAGGAVTVCAEVEAEDEETQLPAAGLALPAGLDRVATASGGGQEAA